MLWFAFIMACTQAPGDCDCLQEGKVAPAETGRDESGGADTSHTGETGAASTDTSGEDAAKTFEATCLCSEDNVECTIDPGWTIDGAEPIQISQVGRCNPAFSEPCDWRVIKPTSLNISATGAVTIPCGDANDWESNETDDGYICRYTEIKIFMRRGW